jgi:hypothetical protein
MLFKVKRENILVALARLEREVEEVRIQTMRSSNIKSFSAIR